jgi:hypothetical protein
MAAQKDGIVRAQDDEQDVGSVGEDEQAFQWHKKHLTVKQGDRNREWYNFKLYNRPVCRSGESAWLVFW